MWLCPTCLTGAQVSPLPLALVLNRTLACTIGIRCCVQASPVSELYLERRRSQFRNSDRFSRLTIPGGGQEDPTPPRAFRHRLWLAEGRVRGPGDRPPGARLPLGVPCQCAAACRAHGAGLPRDGGPALHLRAAPGVCCVCCFSRNKWKHIFFIFSFEL